MFCKNCGSQLADDAVFCGNCGTKVEAQAAPQPAYTAPQQPAYTAPQPTYTAPQPAPAAANDPALDSLATNTMVFGILGAALGLCIGVPGIIFSVLTKNKVDEFVSRAGSLYGKAKVGSILSKVGLPVSIVCTAIYTISFFVGLFSGL